MGALADNIRKAGVSACFGIPGSGASMNLIDALGQAGTPFYLTHHEASAAIMAATFGHLAGTPGMSMSIKGPGVANALPGLALAWYEAFPLIHIAEATPADAPPWVAHKRIAQDAVCQPVLKGSGHITGEGSAVASAVSLAASEEPGPVLLEFGKTDDVTPAGGERIAQQDAPIAEAISRIKRAEKPVLVLGGSAARQKLGDAAAGLGIPVFHSVAAKGAVDESLPHSAGVFTGVEESLTPEARVLPEADLVIAVGLSAREMLKVAPFSAPALHFGDAGSPGLAGFEFELTLPQSDVGEALQALRGKSWGAAAIAASKKAVRDQLKKGFLPGNVYEAVHSRFGGDARLVVDTGSFCTVAEYIWSAKRPDLFVASAQGRYMGTGLPMALGASIFDRSVPTIVTVGDGGIGMYVSDMRLAVVERLPLMLVLATDGGFGSIRYSARRNGYALRPLQSRHASWLPVLEGLGVPGRRVESVSACEAVLADWNPGDGPFYLEAAFDPDSYESMTAGVRI